MAFWYCLITLGASFGREVSGADLRARVESARALRVRVAACSSESTSEVLVLRRARRAGWSMDCHVCRASARASWEESGKERRDGRGS